MNVDKVSDIGREIQSYTDIKTSHRSTSGLSDISVGTQETTFNNRDSEAAPEPENPIKMIDVHQAVEKLNQMMRSMKRDVSFSVDEDANATVIKIFRAETGELLKQFPPEEILAMKAKIRENIGWLIDSKA